MGAAGCLISDGEYRVDMEQIPWCVLVKHLRVHVNNAAIITTLQSIHDGNLQCSNGGLS